MSARGEYQANHPIRLILGMPFVCHSYAPLIYSYNTARTGTLGAPAHRDQRVKRRRSERLRAYIRKRAVGLRAIHYYYTNTRSSSGTQVLDGRLLALSRGCGAPVGRVRRKAPDHVGTSLEGSRSSSSESTTAPNCVRPPRSHDLKSAQLTCRRASSDMYSRSSSTWSGQA